MDSNVWQEFQADRQHAITRAFRELRERWDRIWGRESARLYWATHERKEIDSWDRGPVMADVLKAPGQFEADLQKAVRDMREATETRLPYEAFSGYGSYLSGPSPERRGWARDEAFHQELAVASPEHLHNLLQQVETMQREHTPKDYQWWDLQQGATMIREELGQRAQADPRDDRDGEWAPAQRQQYREEWAKEQAHYRAQELRRDRTEGITHADERKPLSETRDER